MGFHRATRYPEQIKAIAYMEAITMPRRWEDFGEAGGMFRGLRLERGEQMVLDENFFVETVLLRAILRKLSDQEMAAYGHPVVLEMAGFEMTIAMRFGRLRFTTFGS